MHKGIKVLLTGQFNVKRFNEFIISYTKTVGIHGTIQMTSDNQAVILAEGEKDKVESLIDELYNENNGIRIESLDTKPLDESKDFRGIFRIVHN